MLNLLRQTALSLCLAAAAMPAYAADPDGVGALLEQQKIKYEVDEDKDYKIVYDFSDEKRSQVVYVSGKTEEYQGFKIRSIFAPAVLLKKDNIDGKQQSLLEHNGQSKIGAWEIYGDVLYFSAKLIEPVTGEQLKSMTNLVASIADDKEIEISGKRDEL